MILGLDISTSTVGISVINEKKEIILLDYIKPIGDNYIAKALDFSNKMNDMIKMKIDKIMIERANMRFQEGKSKAQIIALILRFNGIVGFLLFTKFGIMPEEITAISARKQVTGIGRYPKEVDQKLEVWKWVNAQYPNREWPKKVRGPNKGNLANEAFDMSDATIVALSGV